MRKSGSKSGFTLIEVMVVTAVIAVLVGLFLPAMGRARGASKLAISLSNLRQSAVAAATYAADFDDRIYALSSAPNSRWPELRPGGSALRDAAKHAIDIIRRRTGREDFPVPSHWIPNVLYTHLVLNDYLGQNLPDRMVVSPEDEHRLNWQIDPINLHDQGAWQPFQNPESGPVPGSQFRWPYSSSYQVVVASYDGNQSRWNGNLPRISPATHNSYFVPTVPLGGLRMSSVTFPGSKVHVHDSEGRHTGPVNRYYAHERAKVVLHMFDGSASFRLTRHANIGWNPVQPRRVVIRPFISYRPRSWEAPILDLRADGRTFGYYRWTRGGLKGIDFGGNEINTGQ